MKKKKIILNVRFMRLLVFALLCGLCTLLPKNGAAQTDIDITAAFTDVYFRNKVYDAIGKTAPAPILNTDAERITGLFVGLANISSMDGIQYFTNLEELACYGNRLTALDVSALKKLKSLRCYENQLTSLKVSGLTKLETLECSSNKLTSLSVTGLTKLETLECHENELTSLNVSRLTNLHEVDCRSNKLTVLHLSGTTNLQSLYCTSNLLQSLDVSALTNLQTLWCKSNLLQSLNVSGLTSLQTLDCSENYMLSTANVTGWTEGKGWIFAPQKPVTDITAAFTDDIFRNKVYAAIGKTAPTPILNADVLGITSLDVYNSNIVSLSGIQYFANLQSLECSYNKLTALDVTMLTKLRSLACNGNLLTAIDVSELTNLQEFSCSSNQLTVLNVSASTNLQDLRCFSNQLTALNVSGLTNLQTLRCYSNQLTALNVSGLTNLKDLRCYSNQLTALNVSGLTNLQTLECRSNQLTELNVSGLTNLQTLECRSNQLTELNVSGLTNLQTLNCYSNQLTALNISELMNLQTFNCNDNYIASRSDVIGWIENKGWKFDPQNVRVTGVTLNTTAITISIRSSETLTATIVPENASNKTITWNSSSDTVAKVSTSGKVTGVSEGTAIITVTTADANKIATCTVTVVPRVSGVTLNKTETTIIVDSTEQLTATVVPANAINKAVTWSSSRTSVATVSDSGLVTSLSTGKTTITVKTSDGSIIATCTVTVVRPVTDVTLNKTETTVNVGATEQLTATVAPENATNKAITWSSSDTTVATVSNDGLVKGFLAGTAAITVTTADGNKIATCAVTVNDLPINLTALVLDGGVKVALYRNVRLNCTFSGGVPTHFRTAESETEVNSAAWQSYNAASLFHTFASEAHGYKTVYAQLKNTVGETTVQNAVIIYKPEHPKQEVRGFAINAGAWATESRTVTLTHSVINAVPTLYSASENPLLVGKEWLPYKALPQFTLSNGAGLKEVYFAVANAADTSAMVSAQIWLDEPVTKADNETEASSALSVKLYPNPVKTAATVEVDGGKGKVQISVYDVSCRMYLSRTFDAQTFSLDLTDCPSGILLVRIVNNGNSVIKKVIKN